MGEYFLCTQRERLREAAVLAGIAAFVVLIRAPFNANVGVDEGFYLVVARQWLHGLPPYTGAFDVKPPLLFALMAGAEMLFGPSLAAAKALSAAAAALTACGLYLFGVRFLGKLAGLTAAFLYALSVLSLGGTFSPAELLMAPFTAFGWLAGLAAVLDRTPRRLHGLGCFGRPLRSGCLREANRAVRSSPAGSGAPLQPQTARGTESRQMFVRRADPAASFPRRRESIFNGRTGSQMGPRLRGGDAAA